MAVFSHACPYCHLDVAFQVLHERIDPQHNGLWLTCSCPKCYGGVIAKVRGDFPNRSTGSVPGDIRVIPSFVLDSFAPEAPPIEAPDHLPVSVLSAYFEAMHNLDSRHWNSAGMMFRRAIDLATKVLLPESKGDLYKRIDQLATTNDLTPSMQKWAHHIRLEGNAAAHDLEEITEADAQGLQAFTELFLTYQFTLPAMLAAHYSET